MEYKTFELNKKHKPVIEAWIKKLESGQYLQRRGLLKDINVVGEAEYCCLGVYGECILNIDLDTDNIGETEWLSNSDLTVPKENKYKIITELMSSDGLAEYLSILNDGHTLNGKVMTEKHSFQEIANYLKKYIKYV